MTNQKKVLKMRDSSVEIEIGQSVWVNHANGKGSIEEYFIISIGNKLVGISKNKDMDQKSPRVVKFNLEGAEQGQFDHHSLYSSKEAYINQVIVGEAIFALSEFVRSRAFKEKFTTVADLENLAKSIGFEDKLEEIKAKRTK